MNEDRLNQVRTALAQLWAFWKYVALPVVLILLLLIILLESCARGDLADCIDATCRINSPDGGRGSGCVCEIRGDQVIVVTTGHVVEGGSSVTCEFWSAGHQSVPLAGRVVQKQPGDGWTFIAVPVRSFAGRVPRPIPLAQEATVLRAGDTLTSVGCANGAWSTGWKGHALGYEGGDLHFLPTPANGRSGSALFNADGSQIVGIVRARDERTGHGVATSIQALYRRTRTAELELLPKGPLVRVDLAVQCGPGGCPGGSCPTPGGSRPSPGNQWGGGYIQGPRGGTIGGGGNYSGGPWPTLPSGGPGPAEPSFTIPVPAPAPRLNAPGAEEVAETIHRQYLIPFRNDINRRLDGIEQQIQGLHGQPGMPYGTPLPLPPPATTPDENPDQPKTLPGRIAERQAEWLAEHGGPISSRLAQRADDKLDSDSAVVRFVGFTQAKVALLIFCLGVLLIFSIGLFLLHRLNNRLIPKLQAAAARTSNTIDDKLVGLLASIHDRVGTVESRIQSHLPDMAALRAKAEAALHIGTAAALATPAGPAAVAAATGATAAAEAAKAAVAPK